MQSKQLFVFFMLAVLPFCVSISAAQENLRSKTATLRGFIAVVEEGEEGEPLLIAIVTDDGYDLQYYYVVKEGKGRELFGEIGSTVSATGLIERHSDGRKWLRIQRWEIKSGKPDNAILQQMQNRYNETDIPESGASRTADTASLPVTGLPK